jgi:hypothetical protein
MIWVRCPTPVCHPSAYEDSANSKMAFVPDQLHTAYLVCFLSHPRMIDHPVRYQHTLPDSLCVHESIDSRRNNNLLLRFGISILHDSA